MYECADELFPELATEIRFGNFSCLDPVRCLAHSSLVGGEDAVFQSAGVLHLGDLGRRFGRFGEHVLWGRVP